MRPDDGRDGIIKIAVVAAHHLGQRGGEVLRKLRARPPAPRSRSRPAGSSRDDSPVHQRDAGRGPDSLRHSRREGPRSTARPCPQARGGASASLRSRCPKRSRISALSRPMPEVSLVRAQGIGTDQPGQPVIDMRAVTKLRASFEQGHLQTGPRQTQVGLQPARPPPINRIAVFSHAISFLLAASCSNLGPEGKGGGAEAVEGKRARSCAIGVSGRPGKGAFGKRLPFPRAPIPAKTFVLVSARGFAGGEPPERDGPRRSCCARSSTIPGHPGAHGAPRVAPLPVLLR